MSSWQWRSTSTGPSVPPNSHRAVLGASWLKASLLPAGFQRIRYYGPLGNRHRKEKLARCRHLLGMPADEAQGPTAGTAPDYQGRYEALTGVPLRRCPVCHEGCMQVIEILPPNRRNRLTAITDSS